MSQGTKERKHVTGKPADNPGGRRSSQPQVQDAVKRGSENMWVVFRTRVLQKARKER